MNQPSSGAATEPSTAQREWDDEISLVDLWLVLVRRKWVVWITALLVLAAAGAAAWLTKPVYESRVAIELGRIGTVGALENPNDLAQRLREFYRVGDRTEGPIPPPFVAGIEVDSQKGGSVLEITARDHSAEGARAYLEQVTKEIVEQQNALYQETLRKKREELDLAQQQLRKMEQSVAELTGRLEAVGASDAALAGLLSLEKSRLMSELPEAKTRVVNLEIALSELQSNPTRVIRQPTEPVAPIKPRPKLYLTLALVVGLITGVFLAFFAEFLSNARKEMARRRGG